MNTYFFLGANSPGGFASYYDNWLNPSSVGRVYIIKGSPGNGKSSFMKRIAKSMESKGQNVEYILCSADAGSFDGIFIPSVNAAFVDGTAPHVVEPKYPLVCETYLQLTHLVDDKAVSRSKRELIELTSQYKALYSRLYRILSAVKSLQDEQSALVRSVESEEKIRRRAKGIIKREIKRKKDTGSSIHNRFLTALSPEGETVLWDTVRAITPRVFEIEDNYGQAHIVLSELLAAGTEHGLDIYACYDPMEPYTRLAHLIFPELGLSFITSRHNRKYDGSPERRIRLDACVPPEIMQRGRLRLRFLRKTENALLSDASEALSAARDIHDRIEAVYNPHVDFHTLRALSDAYAEKLAIEINPS